MKRLMVALVAMATLVACSSSAHAKPQIKYGTSAAEIAKTLGICKTPEKVDADTVRCRFADGAIVVVNRIAGPADQEQEMPAAQANDFCELVGHGFGVTAPAWSILNAHVHLNALVAKYGGKFGGAGC